MVDDTDVLVVGAGPTGLLLAGDLAAAGVRTTVLERRAGTSNLTRAFAVHARTLELLDARGVADELLATGTRVGRLRLFGRIDVELSRLPSRYPCVLVTPQYETERVLRRRAVAAGAELVEGAEVAQVERDTGGVTVTLAGGSRRRAAYLVGADGRHSRVRGELGVDFPGRSLTQSVLLADVRLADPPPDVLTVDSNGAGFAFLVPYGDGWWRVIVFRHGETVPDSTPVDFDEVRSLTAAVLGTDHGMRDPRWLSRFHNDERQVARYRHGRVFLAGDAAHAHSPAGGQGMNAGLGDAANLGWKLAAAVRGHDHLLDTYQSERHPVGAGVIRLSATLLRAAALRAAPARAARLAIGTVASHLRPVTDRAARQLSGIAITYPRRPEDHRVAGQRAPDVRLTGGRLYEQLRTGRFALVAARTRTDPGAWADRVDAVTAPVDHPLLTLVRPDGYVAWASDDPDPVTRDADLHRAFAHWCGPR